MYIRALLYRIRVLMGCGGEAGCAMSAEGLAVLAAQGVAHCPSLSMLYLHGKTGVCVCARACSVVRRLGPLACACGGGGGLQGAGRCTTCLVRRVRHFIVRLSRRGA